MSYQWIPGDGADYSIIMKMKKTFLKPNSPMGEAWFMGEKRLYFKELMGDINEIAIDELMRPFEEISSGTSSFGPLEEWHEWYLYLMPQTLHRAHENHVDSFLEYLITSFCTQFPEKNFAEPYFGFKDDCLQTVGKSIMAPECWVNGHINIGRILHRSNNNPNKVWGWWDTSGDFSASMAFCLRYLDKSQIASWLNSVFDIKCPHWRAQLIVWLVGFKPFFDGSLQHPSQILEQSCPNISWSWSHCLTNSYSETDVTTAASPFFSDENISEAKLVIQNRLSYAEVTSWLESMQPYEYLIEELQGSSDTLISAYFLEKHAQRLPSKD